MTENQVPITGTGKLKLNDKYRDYRGKLYSITGFSAYEYLSLWKVYKSLRDGEIGTLP